MYNCFFNLNIEDFDYFKVIIVTFKKQLGDSQDWNEFFKCVDNMFNTMKERYVLILDISCLSFPGAHIIKKTADILKKYPNNIDNYTIESKIIAPKSYLSKSILNILFTIYKGRRPIKVEYSFENAYNDIVNTLKKYTKD